MPASLLRRPALGSGRSSRRVTSALDGIWTRDLLRDRQANTPGCSTRACSCSSGSGGTRTHSIPGSKPRWSAGCLPSHSAQSGSRTRKRSGLGRAALPRWRIWARVVPDGVEPSFPGCGPSVVAVGPRDHVFQVESPGVAPGSPACDAGVVLLDHAPQCLLVAEAVGLEPTSGMSAAACFPSRFLNRSDGFHRDTARVAIRPTKAEAVGLEPTSGSSPPPVFRTGSSSGRMASSSSCGGWT